MLTAPVPSAPRCRTAAFPLITAAFLCLCCTSCTPTWRQTLRADLDKARTAGTAIVTCTVDELARIEDAIHHGWPGWLQAAIGEVTCVVLALSNHDKAHAGPMTIAEENRAALVVHAIHQGQALQAEAPR